MCCLLIALLSIGPRGAMFIIWILTDWFTRGFSTWYWPLLGFFFLPWTTLTYMGIQLKNNGQFSGFWLALFILAIMIDISSNGAAGSQRKRNRE